MWPYHLVIASLRIFMNIFSYIYSKTFQQPAYASIDSRFNTLQDNGVPRFSYQDRCYLLTGLACGPLHLISLSSA